MDLWREPSLEAVAAAVGECVLGLDGEGRVRLAAGSESVGFLPGDPLGAHYTEVLPAAAAEEVTRALSGYDPVQGPQRVSFELMVAGGRRCFRGRLVVADQPEQRCAILILRDATAETLAEEAEREAEAMFRLIAESSSDVISVENPEGLFLYISPGVERLVGYRPEEVVGRSVDEFWHPDDLQRVRTRSPAGGLLPPEGGARVRHRLRHRDGRWVWAETDARSMVWQGQPAVISDTRDITQRKLVEEEARAAIAGLEEARGKAEAANRAKSDFLAAMGHGLRTPLHGILGMAELLQQTHLADHQREYLDAIRESGRLLLTLLNDLQDLNEIESRRLVLRSAPFDLVEGVEGLADILGPEAASRGVQLSCQVAPELPTVVLGDSDRLRQLLVNLLGVALRCGTREIRLTASRGGQRILFEVALGSLASPGGHRGDAGLALGLSIARGLLAQMGGELEGEIRAGEVIRFELPLSAAQQAADRPLVPLEGTRVLLAIASADQRLPLRDALEQAGAEVELASGGVEVIRTLRDEPRFSCVVLDAALPDIDGGSLATLIRARADLSNIPILLIRGQDDHPAPPGVLLNGLLGKPTSPELLMRAVSTVVAGGTFDRDGIGEAHDRTVLLVEDNELNLRLARDMLRRAGYRVVGARTGAEALENLGRYAVDAVLMDIQLPDMDGLEATARIRRLPAGAKVPIVAMTAHAMKGDAERFIEAGLDDYLSKPVDQEALLQTLARSIRRRLQQ